MMQHDFSNATVTNTKIAVGATTTTILLANGKRRYTYLVNDSNEAMYIALGGSAVMNEGILLPIGASFEISGDEPFKGVINAICLSGSKNLTLLHA